MAQQKIPDEEFSLEEKALAAELRRLAQNPPIHPEFEAALEDRLMRTARKNSPPSRSAFSLLKALAWGAAALILLFGLAWALSNLLPRAPEPAAPPVNSTQTIAPTLTQQVLEATPQATPSSIPSPQPTESGEIYSLFVQPDVDFVLQAGFPENPPEVELYQQIPWEALTIEASAAMAARLGVQGDAYILSEGSQGLQNSMVWDGNRRVIFNSSPHSFEYESGNPSLYEKPDCQAPCLAPGTESALMDWLTQHGLLDLSLDIQLSDSRPQVEYLVQMLEGLPLLYRPGEYQGEGFVGSQGQILHLIYQPANLQKLGQYPIVSASQAWQEAVSTRPRLGIELSAHTPSPTGFRNWTRIYPLNEPVELFGNLQVFQPAVSGNAPLVLFDGDPVQGNIQGMAEAATERPFVQIWGQFQPNEQGGRELQVEGWQLSAFPYQSLSGMIVRREGKAYLQTENQILLMPDLPDDVPEGETLITSGVILEQPEPALAWSSIATDVGGGGGGGGSNFLAVNLAGDSNLLPAQTPTPIPALQSGQRVEGLQGNPIIFIYQYEDGSTRVEVRFQINAGQLGSDATSAYLEGPGLKGIEALHNLPARVWGTFGEARNGMPTIQVERVEPVYLGLTKQAWLGRFERTTLEGQDVLLFTAQDGSQYVLNLSLEAQSRQLEYTPGDPVIVEGYVIPEKTFGGYPLIQDFAIHPGQGLADLNGYQATSIDPLVIQQSETAGAARKATITGIELAYYDDNPYLTAPEGAASPYVQPVWRFTGTYEDGSLFEILVQALDPRYLVPR